MIRPNPFRPGLAQDSGNGKTARKRVKSAGRHVPAVPKKHSRENSFSSGTAGVQGVGPVGGRRVRYVQDVAKLEAVPAEVRERLAAVAKRYVFRANDYYLGLIDWSDPDDPIRQLIIPRDEELNDWGRLDASNELSVTVTKGVQHKYRDTVLLLCNEVCGAYCRYCFRKRLFMNDNDEVSNDISEGLAYIAEHPEVSNVLLTGGDPLLMSTRRIAAVLESLRAIEHVKIVRIGSKMPAFDPWRILNDGALQQVMRAHSVSGRRIHLMAHFDHPRELTDEAVEGIDRFLDCGVVCVNQCPLIRGVNDDADVLAEMYERLSHMGCPPYYLFQGRPTQGNEPYELSIVRGWEVFQGALRRGSGLARRARFVMSHEVGKIEMVGLDATRMYMRFHRSKFDELRGLFMVFKRNADAQWLCDLTPESSFVPPECLRPYLAGG